jgi:hypothetical protein
MPTNSIKLLRPITYALAIGLGIWIGSRSKDKPYQTRQIDDQWYLETPTTTLPIEQDQVGTLEHRLYGILNEEPAKVQYTLEKITGKH